MIRPEEVFPIGKFSKPHGVQGEMALVFTDDIFDRVECPYLVCSMEGILVPFFIEDYRLKSDAVALIKFERVDSAEAARQFTNKEVYFPKKYAGKVEEELPNWNYFVGFQVEDSSVGLIGHIVEVDDTTENVLFVVERPDGSEVLIPAREELMESLDAERQLISFNLPDGLLE